MVHFFMKCYCILHRRNISVSKISTNSSKKISISVPNSCLASISPIALRPSVTTAIGWRIRGPWISSVVRSQSGNSTDSGTRRISAFQCVHWKRYFVYCVCHPKWTFLPSSLSSGFFTSVFLSRFFPFLLLAMWYSHALDKKTFWKMLFHSTCS